METEQKTYECVNETEKFWDHFYLVSFASCLGWDSAICVNADNEQDAIDYAADYAQDQGWEGYFLDPNDSYTQELESFGEVDCVGNNGRLVQSTELNLKRINSKYVTFKQE